MRKLRKMIASLSVAAVLSTLVVSQVAFAQSFSDVDASDYYYNAVEELVALGVIDTTSATYNPGGDMARSLAAAYTVLAGGYPLENPATPTFVDVPKTHPHYQYVETAAAYGIVSGYSHKPGYFGPGDTLTREQYAKMTVEAFGIPFYTPSTPTFPDVTPSMWSYDHVETAYFYQIINGHPDGTFRPMNEINRADAAVITQQALYAEPRGSVDDDDDDDVVDDDDDVVLEGDLTVELCSDSPEGDTLPDGATAVPVAKWCFTANGGAANLSSLAVHTYGVTSLPSGHNVYLYDGADRLTSGKSVNSSTALATFNGLDLDIASGETLELTLKLSTGAVGGVTATSEAAFEIEDAADVGAGDAEVAGDFPIQADTFTLSTVNAGTITIEKNGTITNAKVGEDDATIAKFKMNAATEAGNLEELGLLITGTISSDAVENLELYVSGVDDPIAEVAGLNSKDIAAFVLDPAYVIAKGETKSFWVKADFNTGRSADTVKVYIDESTDVVAIGDKYGYGMNVVINTATTGYDGTTTACTSSSGTCSYSTLQGGDVTVTSSGPAATSIGIGEDEVHMMDFSIVSISEITIKNWPISLVTGASAPTGVDGMVDGSDVANYTDIKVVNTDTAETLMGPIDADAMKTTSTAGVYSGTMADISDQDGFYLFTDEFDMSPGEELNLALTLDVRNTANLNAETIYGTIDLGGTYPEIKDVNNKTVTNSSSLVPAATITGKTMTVASPSLTTSLAAVPVTTTQVKGQKDVKFLGITAQCGSASDCKLTDVSLTGYIDDDADGTFEAGAQTLAGDASSHVTALNAYVGSVWLIDGEGDPVAASQSVNGTTGVVTYDNLSYLIPAGDTVIIYAVGNISSSAFANSDGERISFGLATTGISFEDDDGTTRTSTGAVNGTTSPTTYVATSAGGSLTVAVDASTTKEDILVAGTTANEVSKFKFTTTDEPFTIQKLSINARQANAGTIADVDAADLGAYDNNISKVTISYVNSDGATETKNGFLTSGTASFSGMDMYIEKDDDAVLTVYSDLNTISGGAQAGEFVDLNIAFNDFEALAESSGETYTASKLDADTLAASDLDFGSITWTDSAYTLNGAQAVGTLGATMTLTVQTGTVTGFPVGTLLYVDVATAGTYAEATENLFVTTAAWSTTVPTVRVLNNADASMDTALAVYYALPGTGYLTSANQMHVYEAKPEVTIASSSPTGSRSVAAVDDAFAFDVEEVGGVDKFQIRAAFEENDTIVDATALDTCDISTDGTAGDHIDGTSAKCTLDSIVAGDAFLWATTDLDDYARVNFWFQYENTVGGADPEWGDFKILTTTLQTAVDGVLTQETAFDQTSCGADGTLVVSTEWYNCDLAMPTDTDSGDLFFGIEIHEATQVANTDIIYVDEVKFYNDKIIVDISTDTDLDTYANNTSNAAAPSAVLLKEGGSTVATAYWDTLTNGASATTTAQAVFIPTTVIEVSKGTTKTFTVQADTADLLAEDGGENDRVTFSIDLGTSSAGTPSGGNLWWNDTNFSNVTAGSAPGTSYAWATTPGIIKWIGQVTNSTLNGNTVNY